MRTAELEILGEPIIVTAKDGDDGLTFKGRASIVGLLEDLGTPSVGTEEPDWFAATVAELAAMYTGRVVKVDPLPQLPKRTKRGRVY